MEAQSGLSFGQLWQGDAGTAKKELDKIFGKGKLKFEVVAESPVHNDDPEEKCMAVSTVLVHGTEVHAFMVTGATPNVMSPKLVTKVSLKPEYTSKVVTVATGDKSGALGKLIGIPVLLDTVRVNVDFIVLQNIPFDLVIGRPTLKRLGAVLDFPAEVVQLSYKGKEARLPMISEYVQPRQLTGDTNSEDFTSESENEAEELAADEESEEEQPVLMLLEDLDLNASESKVAQNNSELALDLRRKLTHLESEEAIKISRTMLQTNVIASSLLDLGPADVPVQHEFELTDDRPIYHTARRMAPKHNEIVRKELDGMLKAKIVTPEVSAWSFPVVIATKKDGKPRFCVDYRMLNQRMRADSFPLPKIQKIFDELAGGAVFSTLDFFSGSWQIRMSNRCKAKTTFVCRYGTFQFEVMPFGLMNAPSTFQRMMDGLLGGLQFAKVYLDDVVVFSKTMAAHMEHLE